MAFFKVVSILKTKDEALKVKIWGPGLLTNQNSFYLLKLGIYSIYGANFMGIYGANLMPFKDGQ